MTPVFGARHGGGVCVCARARVLVVEYVCVCVCVCMWLTCCEARSNVSSSSCDSADLEFSESDLEFPESFENQFA